jgi:predicted flap endonuclease-1-like 5' DNA nuclease
MRSNLTPEEFEAEMASFIRVLDQARRLGLAKAERLQRVRGIAEARELARIRARDGAETDTTIQQSEIVLSSGARESQLQADLKAGDFASRLKPDRISAIGRVIGGHGLPAAGFCLKVSTDLGSLIAEGVVDQSGLFAIKMPRSEFNKRAEQTSQLSILIYNTAGTPVRKAEVPFHADSSVMVWNFDLASDSANPTPCRSSDATLNDVKGLGPSRISKLAEAGILDVEHLMRQSADQIAKVLKIGLDQAEEIIKSAKDLG